MSNLNRELQEVISYGRQQGLQETYQNNSYGQLDESLLNVMRNGIRAYMMWRQSQEYYIPPNSLPSDWTPFGGVPKPMPKPSFPSGGGDFMPFEQPSQRGQVPDWWRMRRRK